MSRPSFRPDRVAWTVLGLTAAALVIGYQIKAQCTGAPFDQFGRSEDFASMPGRICYSDIQFLWSGRDVNNHVFPYLTGWIDGDGRLQGGAIEYPVLSGLLFWVGAIGAHNDAEFLLHMALLLAPFGLLTGWVLAKVSGRTAVIWAVTPPLALYAFHNMELPVVAAATVGFGIMAWADRTGGSIRIPAIATAAVFAVGFDLKIYPGLFVAPSCSTCSRTADPGPSPCPTAPVGAPGSTGACSIGSALRPPRPPRWWWPSPSTCPSWCSASRAGAPR